MSEDPTRAEKLEERAHLAASRWQLLLARLGLPETVSVEQVINFLSERDGIEENVRRQHAHQWTELCRLLDVPPETYAPWLVEHVIRREA